jgi:hypothetical protein
MPEQQSNANVNSPAGNQAPAAPAPPAPPAAPGTQAVVRSGGAVTIEGTTNPAELYQALQAQRRVLVDQLERLTDERQSLAGQLAEDPATVGRQGIEQRIGAVDQRILEVNQQLAASEREIARVAGIPGAAVEPRRPPDPGNHDEPIAIIGTTFTLLVLFPLALAHARRIWRRSAKGVAALPGELMERFTRLEQAVDSVAIEVERISEGQRFVTRLMSETRAAPPLGAGAAQAEPAYRKRD